VFNKKTPVVNYKVQGVVHLEEITDLDQDKGTTPIMMTSMTKNQWFRLIQFKIIRVKVV
jgi:hypothetical protein